MVKAGRRTAWLCALGAVIVGAAAPAGAAASFAGAPTITSATAGQQRITVVFAKPQSDGGAHISSYRVTCRSSDGGAKAEENGLASPITVGSVSVGKHYTCTVAAKNSAGFGSPSAPSAVVVPAAPPGKGLPDPPTEVSARPEIESIRVAFKNVHISGGAHVTGYLAICTSSDGGRQNRHTNSITPITVKHLTAGKTYTCKVASRNPAGYGAFSTPSNAVVPLAQHTAPGPPTNVSASAGVRRIVVTFKKPASDGGERVVSYRATCTSSDGGVKFAENGAKSPITVANLSASKTYTCTVAAKNRFGFGTPSPPSNAVVTRKL